MHCTETKQTPGQLASNPGLPVWNDQLARYQKTEKYFLDEKAILVNLIEKKLK